ncbi:hypothetical protein BV230_09515 [Lactiplantibacillus plantarum]|nr:hypothetical protein BWL06_04885 [Lactiplantibacillus plantarum]QCS78080.1 hypothetical protein FEM46_12585 [Lactiplantibacillus plantarum subsp. plantarum]TYA18382.1 hypothetical protein FXE14_08275 [Lactobacillus sp. LSI2-1]MCT3247280.1 hypothetical protein [Lactiplantibacillus plantarum]MCT3266411.1 hypothetical protein [Lactiplantibacillus plantarum]
MKNNDEFTKSWVRTCPPFEHCSDWKAFQQLAEMPGSRRKTRQLSNFMLTRTFSSGPKLAAFDFGNQHVSIIINT